MISTEKTLLSVTKFDVVDSLNSSIRTYLNTNQINLCSDELRAKMQLTPEEEVLMNNIAHGIENDRHISLEKYKFLFNKLNKQIKFSLTIVDI